MAGYVREDIHGTSPQDIMKINDNMMQLWSKVFGDISFDDAGNDLQNKIATQWVQVQGEGNLDSNNPLRVRFFIPPNIKKVKSTDFNFILERYKMDSGITMGGGRIVDADIALSTATSTINCSVEDTSQTSYVDRWGTYGANGSSMSSVSMKAPTTAVYERFGSAIDNVMESVKGGGIKNNAPYGGLFGIKPEMIALAPVYCFQSYEDMKDRLWIDLALIQHKHDTRHKHTFTQSPHSHTGSVKLNIPDHIHGLREAIQVSSQAPQGVKIKLNGTVINNNMSEANPTLNNIDRTDLIKVGSWNIIEIETTNVARMTVYGTVEVIQNYFK